MAALSVYLPDGTAFPFWDDATTNTRVCHVAREQPRATDEGPGSEEPPSATIGGAAEVLAPGEKVVVHRLIDRECVRPAPNAIDHDILWDIGGTRRPEAGTQINVDIGEEAIVARASDNSSNGRPVRLARRSRLPVYRLPRFARAPRPRGVARVP